jgi:hypothetical protein
MLSCGSRAPRAIRPALHQQIAHGVLLLQSQEMLSCGSRALRAIRPALHQQIAHGVLLLQSQEMLSCGSRALRAMNAETPLMTSLRLCIVRSG